MEKYYPITSLCKEDILQAYENIDSELLPKVKLKLKTMTALNMAYLAKKLSDDYCDQRYWISLRVLFETYFMEEV